MFWIFDVSWLSEEEDNLRYVKIYFWSLSTASAWHQESIFEICQLSLRRRLELGAILDAFQVQTTCLKQESHRLIIQLAFCRKTLLISNFESQIEFASNLLPMKSYWNQTKISIKSAFQQSLSLTLKATDQQS